MLVNAIISALTGGVVGVIAFVVAKSIISAQTTTDWNGAEQAIITIIPTILGLIVIIGMFMGLTKINA